MDYDSIPARFFTIFFNSFFGTMKERIADIVLAILVLIYQRIRNQLSIEAWKENLWSAATPWVWLLCSIAAYHVVRTAIVLVREINNEQSPIVIPGYNRREDYPPPFPHYRLKIWAGSLTAILCMLFISYHVYSSGASRPFPNQSKPSEEVKLFIQCQRSFLPKLPPPAGTLYVLRPWALPAENGGGGLSEQTTTSEFAWPTDKVGLPLSTYKCEVTNYGKEPVANVTLAPTLTFRKAIAQGNGQINSGDVTLSRNWPILIRKIDPGKADSFVFYTVNEYNHFLRVTFPTVATIAVMGDVGSQSVPLTHSALDIIELGPFVMGSQVSGHSPPLVTSQPESTASYYVYIDPNKVTARDAGHIADDAQFWAGKSWRASLTRKRRMTISVLVYMPKTLRTSETNSTIMVLKSPS